MREEECVMERRRQKKRRRVDAEVLFIHGLESGPNGCKVIVLRKEEKRRLRKLEEAYRLLDKTSHEGEEEEEEEDFCFRFTVPNMHMSVWSLDRRNSIVRQLLLLPEFLVTIAAAGFFLFACAQWLRPLSFFWAAFLLTLLLLVLLARVQRWKSKAVARSLDACVRVQATALQEIIERSKQENTGETGKQKQIVVIGSSWGGAVAAQLLVRGHWRGPTLLLAPAIQRVQDLIDPKQTPLLLQRLREIAKQLDSPVAIMHAPEDDTIPFVHSMALCNEGGEEGEGENPTRQKGIRMITVEGGGHALKEAAVDGSIRKEMVALLLATKVMSQKEVIE
ncbi:AB hydrolase-1 domain-containing protein [Balamuthia mandrillaris]